MAWLFLTNYARVLVCVAENPDIRLRAIGEEVGITERGTHRIIDDLETAGYLKREKNGRNSIYTVELDKPLRHPYDSHVRVADLVDLLRG